MVNVMNLLRDVYSKKAPYTYVPDTLCQRARFAFDKEMCIRDSGNRIVRFSDIGRAELGPADIKSYMKMNGVPMVGVVVIPQPGANHIQIADAVYERMENMKKDLPEDVHYSYGFDNTKFIRASIDEVKQTVYEAFVLVIIIIFLFLSLIHIYHRLTASGTCRK